MPLKTKENISLIGAGLSGPVMATYLSSLGFSTDIYESRSDMRTNSTSAGRSINLALSARGIKALKDIGVYEKIKPTLIPMSGRMIHDGNGDVHLQPYGQKKNEVIYSVPRSNLNKTLMDYAESTNNVNFNFDHELQDIDLKRLKLRFQDRNIPFSRILGSDGASSKVREFISKNSDASFLKKPLGHGYKELTIPPDSNGKFQLDSNSLHIWPRGEFMLIALPNFDRSFTGTLFLPMEGDNSFSYLNSEKKVLEFFKKYFPDTLQLISDLPGEYQKRPVGKLGSIYCSKWHYNDRAAIFGDAAHTIVPFFGQGMNASLQDCTVMYSFVKKYDDNWNKIFTKFSEKQIPNGHAIADMALENYIEMRYSVNDPKYKIKRELEFDLENKFWDRFVPRYSMVSFHELPYSEVYRRGEVQSKLMYSFIKGDLTKKKLYEQIESKLTPIR